MSTKRNCPPSLLRRHSWPLSSLESAVMHKSIAEVHDVYSQYIKQRPQLQRTIASINELDRKMSRIWYECAAIVLAMCVLTLSHFGSRVGGCEFGDFFHYIKTLLLTIGLLSTQPFSTTSSNLLLLLLHIPPMQNQLLPRRPLLPPLHKYKRHCLLLHRLLH